MGATYEAIEQAGCGILAPGVALQGRLNRLEKFFRDYRVLNPQQQLFQVVDLAKVKRVVEDTLDRGRGEQWGTSLEATTSVQNLLLVPSVESMAILPGS